MTRKKSVSSRIEWVDISKGLGLILVILGHLRPPYLAAWIYTFHMPLFFFLSGFVFSGNKYSIRDFIKRRIKSLIIPYFVLGTGIYLFHCIIYLLQGEPLSSYFKMLWEFIKQEHYWTVWFLACLFFVEIFYYVIHKVFGKHLFLLSIVSAVVCIVGFVRYRFGFGSIPWNIDVAMIAQFFFHLGYCFRRKDSIQKCILSKERLEFVVIAGVFLFVNVIAGALCIKLSGESLDMSIGMYGNELLTVISALAGIMFIVIVSNKIKWKFFTYLGQNTMIIFAWHSRIMIVLLGYLYGWLGIFQGEGFVERVLYSIISFVIILCVLISITELIKKSKVRKYFGL